MTGMGVIADNGKCAMDASSQNWMQDFTAIPTTDAYGDNLTGAGTYISSASTQVGVNNAISTEQQYRDLSANAADGVATRLRTDANLRIAIYTIGLNSNSGGNYLDFVDTTLLERMANATSSPVYNPSQPVGGYFPAADASVLDQAFASAASAIVARLSR